jgi:hypothetical protein
LAKKKALLLVASPCSDARFLSLPANADAGFNVEKVQYKNVMFTVWDVGGQEKLRPLWRHYFNNTDGLIFVVDSLDRDRIDRAREEFTSIINDPFMRNSAILIFANKQDMKNCLSAAEIRGADGPLGTARKAVARAERGGDAGPRPVRGPRLAQRHAQDHAGAGRRDERRNQRGEGDKLQVTTTRRRDARKKKTLRTKQSSLAVTFVILRARANERRREREGERR